MEPFWLSRGFVLVLGIESQGFHAKLHPKIFILFFFEAGSC